MGEIGTRSVNLDRRELANRNEGVGTFDKVLDGGGVGVSVGEDVDEAADMGVDVGEDVDEAADMVEGAVEVVGDNLL